MQVAISTTLVSFYCWKQTCKAFIIQDSWIEHTLSGMIYWQSLPFIFQLYVSRMVKMVNSGWSSRNCHNDKLSQYVTAVTIHPALALPPQSRFLLLSEFYNHINLYWSLVLFMTLDWTKIIFFWTKWKKEWRWITMMTCDEKIYKTQPFPCLHLRDVLEVTVTVTEACCTVELASSRQMYSPASSGEAWRIRSMVPRTWGHTQAHRQLVTATADTKFLPLDFFYYY